MTNSTRKKGGRVLTVTPKADTSRTSRGRSADTSEQTSLKGIGEAQSLAMALALTLAELASLRASEREQTASPEVTAMRRAAERRLRRQRHALAKQIGAVPCNALVAALVVDGAMALRAAAAAAPTIRDYAVWAAVQGASVAIQRGITDTASLTMLCAAAQWRALESALIAKALSEGGGDKDTLKLASLCNSNARHSTLTADALSRSGGSPIVQPPAPIDWVERDRLSLKHAMDMERKAGRYWGEDEENPLPGSPPEPSQD
jgi:hypothetical protein